MKFMNNNMSLSQIIRRNKNSKRKKKYMMKDMRKDMRKVHQKKFTKYKILLKILHFKINRKMKGLRNRHQNK
jgi:hypothetical protein